MERLLTKAVLGKENLVFSRSPGVSQANRGNGFRPAFIDTETGRVEVSRFADGREAPMHLLDGLPDDWVVARNDLDGITAVKATVVAGFVRGGRFYTRHQAAEAVAGDSASDAAWLTKAVYA